MCAASCLWTCQFSLDGEAEPYKSMPPRRRNWNINFDENENEIRSNDANNRLLTCSRSSSKKNQLLHSPLTRGKQLASRGNDDSSWPCSSDDEYIVFYIKENGAHDVVKEGPSMATNLELNHGEKLRSVYNRQEERLDEIANDLCCPIHGRDCRGLGMQETDARHAYVKNPSHLDSNAERLHTQEQYLSGESRESSQSDGNSRGSFAFPVLSWDQIDSPMRMPRSEGLQSKKSKGLKRKNNTSFLHFRCCRFW